MPKIGFYKISERRWARIPVKNCVRVVLKILIAAHAGMRVLCECDIGRKSDCFAMRGIDLKVRKARQALMLC